MQPYTLTESDVIDLLTPSLTSNEPVLMVAVDYNWGPPISGRFDVDFLQVWAAPRSDLRPRRVSLLGNYGPQGAWSNALALRQVRDLGTRQLYLLDSAAGLATELVIEMEAGDGTLYYDNNGGYGVNYRIARYQGRGASAIAGADAIRALAEPTSFRLVARSAAAGRTAAAV